MVMNLFKKTLPFLWYKVGIYALVTVGLVGYIIISSLIVGALGAITGEGSAIPGFTGLILFIIGLGAWRFVKSYLLYMIKAGHVAVVSELVVKGTLPEGISQTEFAKNMVKKYFLTANAMWVLDNLIRKAVKDAQSLLTKFGEWLSAIPGMSLVVSIVQVFVGVLLNYTDEAIFGYIFHKNNSNVGKSAADGVVIYIQSWKEMTKSAGAVTLGLISYFLVTAGTVYAFFVGFEALGINPVIPAALVLGVFLFVKWVFVDTLVMIYMVSHYLAVAMNQTPAVDIYQKLQGISKRFGKLIGTAGATFTATNSQPAFAAAQPQGTMPASPVQPTVQPGTIGAVSPTPAQPTTNPQGQPQEQINNNGEQNGTIS